MVKGVKGREEEGSGGRWMSNCCGTSAREGSKNHNIDGGGEGNTYTNQVNGRRKSRKNQVIGEGKNTRPDK